MPTIINGTTGIDKVQDDSVDISDLSATGTPSSSTYLRGDNSWASISIPAGGKVLQVVQTYAKPTFSTSSTSFVDYTSASASITPTSSSSKVLVLINFSYYLTGGGDDVGMITRVVRDSTTIFTENNGSVYNYSGGTIELMNRYSVNYLDSPATTSSTTYKLQVAGVHGASVQNYDTNPVTVILMEIAA